jgi:hypothetical protein
MTLLARTFPANYCHPDVLSCSRMSPKSLLACCRPRYLGIERKRLPSATAITYFSGLSMLSARNRELWRRGTAVIHRRRASNLPPVNLGRVASTPPPKHQCTAHIGRDGRSLGCSAPTLLPLYSVCHVLARDCRSIVSAPANRLQCCSTGGPHRSRSFGRRRRL